MTVLQREALARELAGTYKAPQWEHPWDAVEAYQAFQKWYAANPQAGSTAAARALEQPRGRIREWMNGSRPDPIHALTIADQEGWLAIDWEDPRTRALNCLVAWTFSGGSISREAFVPLWTYNSNQARLLLSDCIETVYSDGATSTERSTNRSDELTLASSRSIFGRLLVVLGCPVGEKNASNGPYQLPAYFDEVPRAIQRDFAHIYFLNRGVHRQSAEFPIQIREERPLAYVQHLRTLFGQFVDEVTLSQDKRMLYLSPDANDSLGKTTGVLSDLMV